jgi:hypothetical protein
MSAHELSPNRLHVWWKPNATIALRPVLLSTSRPIVAGLAPLLAIRIPLSVETLVCFGAGLYHDRQGVPSFQLNEINGLKGFP